MAVGGTDRAGAPWDGAPAPLLVERRSRQPGAALERADTDQEANDNTADDGGKHVPNEIDTKTSWLSGLADAVLAAFSEAPADPLVRSRPQLGGTALGLHSRP